MNNRPTKRICWLLLIYLTGCQAPPVDSAARPHRQPRLINYSPGICLDTVNGLMWQAEKSGTFSTWAQAKQFAAQLDTADFNDWRLPTYDELYILRQTLDRKNHGNCPLKLHGSFWTGNSEKEARVGFWDSEPLCGGPSYFFIKQASGSVIAVRLSEARP